jgi:hypothetical protein
MTSPRTRARSGPRPPLHTPAAEELEAPGASTAAADHGLDRRTTPQHPPLRSALPSGRSVLTAPPVRMGGGSQ